jgi:hypothetical protein
MFVFCNFPEREMNSEIGTIPFWIGKQIIPNESINDT